MALASHVLSTIIFTQYLGFGLLFWMILGQIAPDLFKAFIFTGVDERPAWQVQKMLPMGITHVPLLHVGIGVLIWIIHPYSIWPAGSYIFGAVLHCMMDTGDQHGVLLLYPFKKELVSIRSLLGRPLWNCGCDWGGAVDARAYFMTYGGLFEIGIFTVALPGLVLILDRGTYSSTPEAIFCSTFVVYNFLQFVILFLFPIIRNVPIPKDYTFRLVTWRTPREYENEAPAWTKAAQNQMGILMGIAFVFSFLLALGLFL
ncbi:MAG: hypothetical protein ACE5OZ_09720 [Candidatus Heimdallarchaeota archaeon]